MRPRNTCAPEVASALKCVLDEITIPLPSPLKGRGRKRPYSLTSRSPSLWAQLRKHLDFPLAEAIRSYEGPWARKLLMGFRLSTIGQTPPIWGIDQEALTAARHAGGPINWGGLIVPASLATPEIRQNISGADRVLDNVRAWDENLRFVIHSSEAPLPVNVSANEYLQFCSTLDTIRSLLKDLQAFRPQRGPDPLKLHEGTRPRLLDTVTRRQNGSFCELCWRLTMRATVMSGKNVPDIQARRLSDRFCSEHNPSDPSSRYRADQRYKEAFQRELTALQLGTIESAFEVQFRLPRSAEMQEIRKTAYDLVHARLRPLTQLGQPSLRESVWLLHQQGMRQADIARQLKTTRQSVFRAMKSIELLVKTRLREQMLNPSSEENWVKSKDSPLVQSVSTFHKSGYTPAQIARKTSQFKHTILAILRWLESSSYLAKSDAESQN